MRLTKRHRVALAAALLGTALGITPLSSANAAAVAMTLHASGTIDTVGTPEDIDLTLTTPPTVDSFVELNLSTENPSHLTVTDDAGNVLDHQPVYTGRDLATFRFGEEDSDHDGIPGALLSPGALHVRVVADGYVGKSLNINATYIDGATGRRMPISPAHASVNIKQPSIDPYWTAPHWNTVASGVQQPTECRLVTHMGLATPPPSTRTRLAFSAQQIAQAGYTAAQLARDVHVQHSADTAVYADRAWITAADGSLYLDIATQDWTTGALSTTDHLRLTAARGLPSRPLQGTFQTLGTDGTQLSNTPQTIEFAAGRTAFYGRDDSGVLWQYLSGTDGDPAHYTRRTRVGGGWGAYNVLTKLAPLHADVDGALVGRDTSGVLWLYRGTDDPGHPFATRVRVGGGWNTYTRITGAGDLTGDRVPDLVARDRDGVLWLYAGTGDPARPFAARARIGGGWNAYTDLIGAGAVGGDFQGDLLARDKTGVLWRYPGRSVAALPFEPRLRVGGGWNAYTHLALTGDLTGDLGNDLLAIDSAGVLWLYGGIGAPGAAFSGRRNIGHGWAIYNTLV